MLGEIREIKYWNEAGNHRTRIDNQSEISTQMLNFVKSEHIIVIIWLKLKTARGTKKRRNL